MLHHLAARTRARSSSARPTGPYLRAAPDALGLPLFARSPCTHPYPQGAPSALSGQGRPLAPRLWTSVLSRDESHEIPFRGLESVDLNLPERRAGLNVWSEFRTNCRDDSGVVRHRADIEYVACGHKINALMLEEWKAALPLPRICDRDV